MGYVEYPKTGPEHVVKLLLFYLSSTAGYCAADDGKPIPETDKQLKSQNKEVYHG